MKSQATRVLDVAALAPLLAYVAFRPERSGAGRAFYGAAAAATALYNARNYRLLEDDATPFVARARGDATDGVASDRSDLDPYAQAARAFDIFALGPAMIAAAADRSPAPIRMALALGGALTIANNARNFVDRARGA